MGLFTLRMQAVVHAVLPASLVRTRYNNTDYCFLMRGTISRSATTDLTVVHEFVNDVSRALTLLIGRQQAYRVKRKYAVYCKSRLHKLHYQT